MAENSTVRLLVQALRRPGALLGDRGWVRPLVERPGIFDAASTLMQLLDLKRQRMLDEHSPLPGDYYEVVYGYNKGVTEMKAITRTRRAERLIPALVMPPRDLSSERILLVGPRNRHEMLQVWLAGFHWRNIEGIDLYSVNPKISVMNMEQMSFHNGTFDALLSSATVSYAQDVRRCLSEFMRVLRPGGRAVFAHTYTGGSDSAFAGNRVSGAEIDRILRDLGAEQYYRNNWSKSDSRGIRVEILEIGVIAPN